MIGNNYLLWEDDTTIVCTPFNPHLSYHEGIHIIVKPKAEVGTAWQDAELTGRLFSLASKVCKVAEALELSPWFNLQANGNWGLLRGAEPFFHIHIYGRNKTENWGKPVVLPETPGTYQHAPMPEIDRMKLIAAFETTFTK